MTDHQKTGSTKTEYPNSEYPKNEYTTANWASSALVVIDMQVDFAEGGAWPIPGTAAVAPNVRRLSGGYRQAGLPIVHVVRLYSPGGSDVDPPRRAFVEDGGMLVAPGSAGSGLIAGIAGSGSADEGPTAVDADLLLNQGVQQLGENEIVLFKPRWGAFYRTGLQTWLAERGVDTVVLAGCNLPNCPRVTLFEASERDFRTVLALDAVSGASPERLGDLAAIGVNLLPSTAIVRRLQHVRVEV